jgi:hypothetical protein
MSVRLAFVALLAGLALAAATAGGASSRVYAEHGGSATASQSRGSSAGQAGAPAAKTDQDAADTDAADADSGAAAKKGPGYCFASDDGTKEKCPSHGKKAKAGKGKKFS